MNKLIDILLVLVCTAAACGIAAMLVYGIPAIIRKVMKRMDAREQGFLKEQTEMLVFEGEEIKQELHEISLTLKRIAGLMADEHYRKKCADDKSEEFRRDAKAFLNALYGRLHERVKT